MAEDSGRVPAPKSPRPGGESRRPSGSRRTPAVLILIAAGLVVVLAGAFLLWQSTGPAGPSGVVTSPKLVVDRDAIDFGQVPYNKRVVATFALRNAGGTPLQIVGQPRVEVIKGC